MRGPRSTELVPLILGEPDLLSAGVFQHECHLVAPCRNLRLFGSRPASRRGVRDYVCEEWLDDGPLKVPSQPVVIAWPAKVFDLQVDFSGLPLVFHFLAILVAEGRE